MKRLSFYILLALAALVISSCSDDEKYLRGEGGAALIQSYTLTTGDTTQIKLESSLPISYARENSYHINVLSEGKIVGVRIGETQVLVTNGKDLIRLDVKVNPKYFTYPDPYLGFGESKSTITGKLGAPSTTDGDVLVYDSKSDKASEIISEAISSVSYHFNGDKLERVIVRGFLEEQKALESYLGERYYMYGEHPDPHNEKYYMDSLKLKEATVKIDTTHDGEFLVIDYFKP